MEKPCAVFDQAVPGTGPMKMVSASAPSVDFIRYNNSYNLSLRSKSDLNLNPQPEGNVKSAFPKSQTTREGVYAIETDRGELNPIMVTQMNVKGQRQFQARLQDTLKPTTKETTLYTYSGYVAPVTEAQASRSQFIPSYAKIGDKHVRTNGASNYGLRAATEYSYFAGAAPTGLNGQAIQNPDSAIGKNTQPVPDFHVDGPGTFKNAAPNGSMYQQYRPLPQPTTNGLKLNYNLETAGSTLHDYSNLLGKQVDGIENRYTASYQIAPLLSNPLNVIWNPDNKGEIPAFYVDSTAQDQSPIHQVRQPENEYTPGGYNSIWKPDPTKDSTNSYILGMTDGIYNPQLNWFNAPNDKPGVVYSDKSLPGTGYSGNRSLEDMYMGDQESINKAYPFTNRYTTLGDPNAGYVTAH